MAKGRTPSTALALQALRKHCTRLERSLLVSRGQGVDASALRAREKELRGELKSLRSQIHRRRLNPPTSVVPDDPVLAALRDSILLMSRSLSIPVHLD